MKAKASFAVALGLLAIVPATAVEYVTSPWTKKFVDEIPAKEMSKGLVVTGTHGQKCGVFGGELVLRGTNNVAPAFVKVGKNARLTFRHRLKGDPLEVDVTYGGVLDCNAIHGGQAVRRIKVDCRAGAGSLSNVRLVGIGTLELANVDAARATGRIPLDLSAAVDGENICKWNILIDGKSEPANGRIGYDRGALEWREAASREDQAEGGWECLPMWGGGYMQDVVFTSRPNVLYAYADVCGPYRSDDGGKTWQLLGANLSLGARAQMMFSCRTLSVDPRDPDSVVMFAGGEARDNTGGFMVSRNGGKSWRKTGWHAAYGNGIRRDSGRVLTRDPMNPDVLIGGEDWWGLCLSLNNGETWTRTGPTQQWYTCVHFDKVRRGRVYACGAKIKSAPFNTPAPNQPRQGGFFASEDGGKRWSKICESAPDEIVQLSGNGAIVGMFKHDGMKLSDDGGKTWSDFSEGLPEKSMDGQNVEWLALGTGSDFYVAGSFDGMLFMRGKQDSKWHRLPHPVLKCSDPPHEPYAQRLGDNKPEKQRMWAVCSIVIDPKDDRHWFTTDWFEIWESHDAGRNFETRQAGISQLCSMTFECDPLSPDNMAYGVHDMAFIMSFDGGKSFERVPTFWLNAYGGCGHTVIDSVAFSPHESGVVFAAGYCAYGGFGIERSVNHGRKWDFPKCLGLPRRKVGTNAVNTVAFRPDRNELWACVGGIVGEGKGGPYYSTDHGESWKWAGHGMAEGKEFYKIELESGGPTRQIVFSSDGSGVTLSRRNPTVYAWNDSRKTWVETKLSRGARTWKHYSLEADPHTPGRYLIGGDQQIAESTDGGVSWHPFEGYHGECLHLAFDWNTPGLLMLACADAIRVSWNGGKTFELLHDGYNFDSGGIAANESNFSFAVPIRLTVDRKRVYFATASSGVFYRKLVEPAKAISGKR